MDTFQVLRRTNCNPFLALQAIARLAKVDRNATGVEWFPLEYKRSMFFFSSHP